MLIKSLVSLSLIVFTFIGCTKKETGMERIYKLERIGPAQVVQLYADGFDQLTPKEKIFSYYLHLAGLAGRDIAIDQHHPNAIEVRNLIEQIYFYQSGIDTNTIKKITNYLKLFWINNGFYDNITSKKFVPEVTFEDFKQACEKAQQNGAKLSNENETLEQKLNRLKEIIFNPNYEPQMTNKTPGEDWIKGSGVNYYGRNISYIEIEKWAKTRNEKNPLNSKVVKENGKLVENIWRAGTDGIEPGLYAEPLSEVIKYLEMAIPYAANDHQAETVRLLVKYLKTGDLNDFRNYNISWVEDSSSVDFILGFIEVYLDPRGQKAEWESAIFFTNPEQTKLMQNLAKHAQHFEDAAPWADVYKKKIDKSPIANVINVIGSTGGTGPVSPIGINLPNEQAIREEYGSKSVLLHNIVEAYDKSTGLEMIKEFAADETEIEMQEKYGSKSDNLHTAMHEVIGHGSGKVSDKLQGKDPSDFLPGYYNTLEETRADLIALWNAFDSKIVDIGFAKDEDEVRKIGETMYQQTIRVALTQLRRIGKSDQLEQDHMKNRQVIAHYIMENSNAVTIEKRNGKTYYRIADYDEMKKAVGKLLAEVMRIKAEGDFDAAKQLIDKYGFKVNTELRDEVQRRAELLDLPLYTGFVMPKLEPVLDPEAKIIDVQISYPLDLTTQMLEYSAFTKVPR
ncbi:MAG: peptidase M49 [Bacteroidota bacterium]|nr:peptidase M49 [Bacteroidota bacterium]